MATSTYQPNDTDCTAYEGNAAASPPANLTDMADTEFTEGDADTISADDANFVHDIETSSGGQFHRFDIKVQEAAASVTQLDLTWKGYGNHSAGPPQWGYSLWIWNGSTWGSALDSGASDGKDTLTGQKTANLTDYIDGSGILYFLAGADTAQAISNCWTYYAELVVTYSSVKMGPRIIWT